MNSQSLLFNDHDVKEKATFNIMKSYRVSLLLCLVSCVKPKYSCYFLSVNSSVCSSTNRPKDRAGYPSVNLTKVVLV